MPAVASPRGALGPNGSSERSLQVLQGREIAAGVDGDPDRVEANLRCVRTIGSLGQPLPGHRPHAALLGAPECVPWPAAARAARLDLAEHETDAVECHEIELAEARAVVALEYPQAAPLEMRGGQTLAARAEPVAQIA